MHSTTSCDCGYHSKCKKDYGVIDDSYMPVIYIESECEPLPILEDNIVHDDQLPIVEPENLIDENVAHEQLPILDRENLFTQDTQELLIEEEIEQDSNITKKRYRMDNFTDWNEKNGCVCPPNVRDILPEVQITFTEPPSSPPTEMGIGENETIDNVSDEDKAAMEKKRKRPSLLNGVSLEDAKEKISNEEDEPNLEIRWEVFNTEDLRNFVNKLLNNAKKENLSYPKKKKIHRDIIDVYLKMIDLNYSIKCEDKL